jgi:hypothetical protein
MDEW